MPAQFTEPSVDKGLGEEILEVGGDVGAIEPALPEPTNSQTGLDSIENLHDTEWNTDSESTEDEQLANVILGKPLDLVQTDISSDSENTDTDTDTDEISGESENGEELSQDSLLNYPGSAADVAADVDVDVDVDVDADKVRSKRFSVTDDATDEGALKRNYEPSELDQQFAEIAFDSGIFTVGESGKVIFDYLFDGGGYQGEIAAFSLKGMEECQQLGLEAYIKEALRRSSIVISDKTEGARFQGDLGESNQNRGDYQGMKTVEMNPGEEFGILLIPNGTVAKVLSDIEANGLDALAAAKRPLFSMATANPDDGFNFGQIADVYGDNSTFVFEDLRVDNRTDKDYNDVIFQVRGATAETALLADVINPNKDWTDTELGKAVEKYATREVDDGSGNNSEAPLITDSLSDRVNYAIERAENIDSYDTEALADTTQWVVGVTPGFDVSEFTTLYSAEYLGATGHIPNTHVWEFADTESAEQVAQRLDFFNGIEFAYPLVPFKLELQDAPNDAQYDEQWHLNNTGQTGGTPGADANVEPAWDEATGKGVNLAIVEGGLQYDHPDLEDNYQADLSRDFSETVDSEGNITPYADNPTGTYDTDPAPSLVINPQGKEELEKHATAVAGIAVGKGNNEIGVSGVAPDASFGALKLPEDVTDLQIADALSYLNDDIDIYNNSWKIKYYYPSLSDGDLTATGSFAVNPMAEYQLEAGATQGRNGLGNIYVFSAGNDRDLSTYKGDVNQNAFANSRHTIAVAATNHQDTQSVYSEEGTPVFISAPSSNNRFSDNFVGVVTTDLVGSDGYSEGDYTNEFGGTSAAAPVVSGVVALMLEVNPNLTARDVQHILAETARKNDPDSFWLTNKGGYDVSEHYGFGVVDAEAAVALAANWTPVGKEIKASGGASPEITIPYGLEPHMEKTVTISENFTVEWAEVLLTIDHDSPNNLQVILKSPDGTDSFLAKPSDDKWDYYQKWTFTSVHHWGESSQGDWKLIIKDVHSGNGYEPGLLNEWKLNVYGAEPPTVSIEATDPNANEGGDPGEFTISRTGNTNKPLTVTYNIETDLNKAAENGTDYEAISNTIEIPAGQSSVTLPINPLQDTVYERDETIQIQITESENYTVSPTDNLDTVVLGDDELGNPPVANPDTIAVGKTQVDGTTQDDEILYDVFVPEETPLADLLANDTDPDGDPLTITSATPVSDATIRQPDQNGNIVFTPVIPITTTTVPETGSFQYELTDVIGNTATGDVAVDIQAVETIDGSDGNDTLIFNRPVPVSIDLSNPTDQTDNDAITVTNFENAIAGAGNDSIVGSQTPNFLDGDGFSDTLVAVGSNDTLIGGHGNDSLVADGTSDLSGDIGSDTLNVNATTGNSLDGGDGNDSLYGVGGSQNSLVGGAGDDILVAGDPTDTLIGGEGNDFFVGTNNADTLGGSETRAGADTLYGGQGADSLIGTSDLFDGFYYANSNEIGSGIASGADTLTAFESGTDKIYLRSPAFANVDGTGTTVGHLGGQSDFLRTNLDFYTVPDGQDYTNLAGTFSGGSTTLPAIVFDSNDSGGGVLYWDINGGGNTNTGVGDNLSVIATIESGRVNVNDIVIFGELGIPPKTEQSLMGITFEGSLVELDPTTGSSTTIGSTGFSALNSLAIDPQGDLYTIPPQNASETGLLIKIDPQTGQGTIATTFNNDFNGVKASVRALAFSSDGMLYGIHSNDAQDSEDSLFKLNPNTGEVTLIGDTGLSRLQSLAFASDGTLYSWDIFYGLGLVTINPLTGVATDVNPSLNDEHIEQFQGLAFDSNGILYGAGNDAGKGLYKINPITGEAIKVSSSIKLRGIAFVPSTQEFDDYDAVQMTVPKTEQSLIGMTWSGRLVELDPTTGSTTTIGSTGFSSLNSLAVDSQGDLYTIPDSDSDTGLLIKIDPQTGQGTIATTFNNDFNGVKASVRDLTFSSDGMLYGIHNNGGPGFTGEDSLFKLNPNTGEVILIGNTGLSGLQSLAIASDGTLYGWDSLYGLGLVTINPLTGVATDVNPSLNDEHIEQFQGLAFDSNGILYGVGNDAGKGLYKINPITGEVTKVNSSINLRGIAFVPKN